MTTFYFFSAASHGSETDTARSQSSSSVMEQVQFQLSWPKHYFQHRKKCLKEFLCEHEMSVNGTLESKKIEIRWLYPGRYLETYLKNLQSLPCTAPRMLQGSEVAFRAIRTAPPLWRASSPKTTPFPSTFEEVESTHCRIR